MAFLTLKAGLKSLQNKDYKVVHAKCIAALKKDMDNPVPYFLLAVIAFDHGNFEKAIELFCKAEALDPHNAHYPAFLGQVYSQMRQSSAAKLAAERALKCEISEGYLADVIGVIYSRAGVHAQAIPLFEKAVALNPAPANYHYNLGASAQFIGDFQKAEQAYDNAITRDPHHYRAWASKVSLKKQTTVHNHLSQLEKLFELKADNEDAAHQIGHAIAKTLEDLGEYKNSFDWLVKAKIAKRERLRYDRIAGERIFAAAAKTIAATASSSTPDAPIFITGLPRTGTTLVDRILSSHSCIESAGELNIFSELVKSATGTTSKHVLDEDTFKAALSIDLKAIGQAYLKEARARLKTDNRFVDKMPLNFFYAGLIHKALPNAHIIVLRRGAMDSCLSNYRQLLSVQESFYNYTFDLEDTAFFYRKFDALIAHWRAHLPPEQLMEVRYEDIVFDQENQTRRLLDFCGLEFEEACMRFHENTAPVSTASSVQVRQPLYSGSIGRWKKYGEKLNPLIASLGNLAK